MQTRILHLVVKAEDSRSITEVIQVPVKALKDDGFEFIKGCNAPARIELTHSRLDVYTHIPHWLYDEGVGKGNGG